MYSTVRVQNFRGLKDVTAEGLTRVNLIVGQNGVGKTALLEALLLLAGVRLWDPLLAIEWHRGLWTPGEPWRLDGGLFESLFHDFSMAEDVRIEGDDQSFALCAAWEKGQLAPKLSWYLGGVQVSTTEYLADGMMGGQRLDPREFPTRQPVFLGTNIPMLYDEAQLFTALKQSGKLSQTLSSLQVVEPRLRDLTLLALRRGVALHADVGLPKMVPLGVLGEGLQRLCSFVLAASEASDYVLLVDEIDTGLHYSVLTDMWRVVAAAACEFNYQLFATTHSYECMVAAYEAFEEHPKDFSMHRLERRQDGSVVSKDFGHEHLGTALELGFEVR